MLAGFTTERDDVVLLGRETILRNGAFAGYLTSGGYGYTVGRPIGYGYVRNGTGVTEDYVRSATYELVVARETVKARIHLEPLYDASNARVRS
jgi:4-methylaminobutanoate oxidase (formaldehyde-forming)